MRYVVMVSVSLLVCSAAYCVFVRYAEITYVAYTDARLDDELQRGRVVVVLYTSPLSSWGREVKDRVFGSSRMREYIRRRNLIVMEADVGRSECHAALIRDTMDVAIPALVVHRGDRPTRPYVVLSQREVELTRVLSALE